MNEPLVSDPQRVRRKPNVFARMWRNVVSLHGSPREVALGAAIGMWLAFTPTWGIQMIIALILTSFLRASRPAALVMVWVTNFFTVAPIYAFCYWVGAWFWPAEDRQSMMDVYDVIVKLVSSPAQGEWWEVWKAFSTALETIGFKLFMPMMVGGIIVGAVAAVGTYPAVLWGVRRYRRARARLRHRVRLARKHRKEQLQKAAHKGTREEAEEKKEQDDKESEEQAA